jgi:dynein heavy chain
MNLCTLYEAIAQVESSTFKKELLGADYVSVVEKVFIFALTWTVGASVDEAGRKKISTCLADIEAIFPPANTVFDYYIDIAKNDIVSWENRVPTWRPLKNMTFYDMIIPTVDTVRNSYIADTLMKVKKNVLLVGATGTAGTLINYYLHHRLTSTSCRYGEDGACTVFVERFTRELFSTGC